MEPLHIKIELDEAIISKKTLLSTQINLLNIIKKVEDFKDKRKQEFTRKIALRTRLREINLGIKKLKAEMPKVRFEEEKEETQEIIEEKNKKLKLEDELREIRDKLARLG